ncbi:hypothetical protein BS50DRAFT_527433 [Corynespora cassiicola Philippines]|uniref:GA4 desaturase family protein n=1 Tax=Corynespora cassiicola Philippines TaxID=1448308 RepID=A0A2T2NIF8_CORCC|nr:hypothetical protein BS50DRAFT_527433 [Corynespora cassiicola Philippines]
MQVHCPRDVVADINYFPATGKTIETSSWKRRYLGISDENTRSMTIHDVRGKESQFELAKNGFQFIVLPDKERSTVDDATIVRDYYPELEELAKILTGATTAHVFNHVIRQHSLPSDKGKLDDKGRWQDIPSGHPHVDYCGVPSLMEGTKNEVRVPPHIRKLFDTSSRFAFLGAWRPLKTLKKDPLAVADATTVPDSDYQLRARSFPSGIKSGNYVMSHADNEERHQWYYMSVMKPNEIVVFKGYDTNQDLPGWRCPHTAFVLPGTESLPTRESIEARIICFWE